MSNMAIEKSQLQKRPSATWSLCRKQAQEFGSAMAVLTACSVIIYFIGRSLESGLIEDHQVAISILIPMTICFSFVVSFIAFVSENDSRTRSFLMNLPMSSWHIGAVKMLMVVLAVFVFLAVQLAFAGAWVYIGFESGAASIADRNEVIEKLPTLLLWAVGSFSVAIVISLFACSFWASPWASILTAIALGAYSLFACASLFNSNEPGQEPLSGFSAWLLKGSLLLIVIGAVWFPLRWLRRRPWQIGRYVAALVEMPQIESTKAEKSWQGFRFIQLPRGGKFGALIWQSLRQQSGVLTLVFFGVIVLLIFGWASRYQVFRTGHNVELFLSSLVPVLGYAGFVAGWMALHQDKRDRNWEFFQQHREFGVWLMVARIVCSISVLLLLVGLAVVLLDLDATFRRFNSDRWDVLSVSVLMSGIVGYAAMLLCSMVFRSHIYAIAVGLMVWLATIGSYESGWFAWMHALPFLWLISCICYGPAWLAGRRNWRWTVYFTIILLLAFSAPIYILSRRLIEIARSG